MSTKLKLKKSEVLVLGAFVAFVVLAGSITGYVDHGWLGVPVYVGVGLVWFSFVFGISAAVTYVSVRSVLRETNRR